PAGLDERPAVRLPDDVGFAGERFAPLLPDHRFGLPGRGEVAVDQHDARPLACEDDRRSPPVADRVTRGLTRPDHDRDLALKPSAHGGYGGLLHHRPFRRESPRFTPLATSL